MFPQHPRNFCLRFIKSRRRGEVGGSCRATFSLTFKKTHHPLMAFDLTSSLAFLPRFAASTSHARSEGKGTKTVVTLFSFLSLSRFWHFPLFPSF
jgi:hypothetical protein